MWWAGDGGQGLGLESVGDVTLTLVRSSRALSAPNSSLGQFSLHSCHCKRRRSYGKLGMLHEHSNSRGSCIRSVRCPVFGVVGAKATGQANGASGRHPLPLSRSRTARDASRGTSNSSPWARDAASPLPPVEQLVDRWTRRPFLAASACCGRVSESLARLVENRDSRFLPSDAGYA